MRIENKKNIYLMNINANILNKIFACLIQHIKKYPSYSIDWISLSFARMVQQMRISQYNILPHKLKN